MSIQRCAVPLTSSAVSSFSFRFAASTGATTLRTCPFTLRNFNSGSRLLLSSKRKLQTATAYRPHSLDSVSPLPHYRPHSLDSFPLPPRNAGVPDSSIAGAMPEVNETRPPQVTGDHPFPPTQDERQSVSVSEAEAQNSIPVAELPASRPKKSRLRPRKAAISMTPSAIHHLRSLLALPEPKLIRVGVKNRGCSGLAYHLEYVEKAGVLDEAVEQDGVKVLIDSKALFSIIGSEMDWVEDKLNQRFVFRNPNISKFFCLGENMCADWVNRGTMRLRRIFYGLALQSSTTASDPSVLAASHSALESFRCDLDHETRGH